MPNLPTNRPTSPQKPAGSLDVDGLFLRLHTMYGRAWLDMWADAPIPLVKAQWSESLCRFSQGTIQMALAALEKAGRPFPPTLPEIVSLCDQFRPKHPPVLALTYRQKGEIPQHIRDVFAKIKGGA